MRVSRLLAAAGAAWSLVIVGCEGEPRARDRELVRDSAGIRIVENPEPRWPGDSVWVVDPEPQLEIGSLEGDEASSFYRIAHAARLSDGRILVLDGSSFQLRYFQASGDFLHRAGTRGSGPGEFQALSHLQVLPADSVLVYDLRQSRVTVYDAAGTLAHTTRLIPPVGLSSGELLGRFSDGSFSVRHEVPSHEAGHEASQFREIDLVVRYHASGAVMDTLAAFAGAEFVLIDRGSGRVQRNTAPFARRRHYLLLDRSVVSGDNEVFQFLTQDGSGRSLRLVRLDLEPEPVTAQDRRAFPPVLYPAWIMLPGTKPAFQRMLADPDRNLWVEQYRGRTDSAAPRWEVMDQDGRWITSVRTPPELHVTQFGGDYVLGTVRDSLDTEYVRLYPLVKYRR